MTRHMRIGTAVVGAVAAVFLGAAPAQAAPVDVCGAETFDYAPGMTREVKTQRCLTVADLGAGVEVSPQARLGWCKANGGGAWPVASCEVEGGYRLTSPSGAEYTGAYPAGINASVLGYSHPCEAGEWTLRNYLTYTVHFGSPGAAESVQVSSRRADVLTVDSCV